MKFATLGMASPFVSPGIGALTRRGFIARMAEGRQQTRDGLPVSPSTAPSQGVKPCTHHHRFGRLDKVWCEPCDGLPMSIMRLRALTQFTVGSHSLPIERGRFVRPSLPHHLSRYNLCSLGCWQ